MNSICGTSPTKPLESIADSEDVGINSGQTSAPGATGNTVGTYKPEDGGTGAKPKTVSSALDAIGSFAETLGVGTESDKSSVTVGDKNGVSTSASYDSGGVSASAHANASANVTASANAQYSVGPSGVNASASAGFNIGVSANADASFSTPLVGGHGEVQATASIAGSANAYIAANTKGAEAGANASLEVLTAVNANGNLELPNGMAGVTGQAYAQSGSKANASAKVTLTYEPLQAAIDVAAGAFAGARAAVNAQASIFGVGYQVQAEAWAGVGARAEIAAGLHDGKFEFTFGIGIALGVGVSLQVHFEGDFRDLGSSINSVVGIVGSVVSAAGQVVGGVFDAIFGGIFDAVAGLFGGKPGNGAHAEQIIDLASTMKSIEEALKKLCPEPPSETSASSDDTTELMSDFPENNEPAEALA